MTYVTFEDVYTLGPHPTTPGDLEPILVNRLNPRGSLMPMPGAASTWAEFKEVEKGVDSCRIPRFSLATVLHKGGRLTLAFTDANGQLQTVSDIPYDAPEATLKSLLEDDLPYVRELSVSYSSGDTLCSPENLGIINTISITFLWMIHSDGDDDGPDQWRKLWIGV